MENLEMDDDWVYPYDLGNLQMSFGRAPLPQCQIDEVVVLLGRAFLVKFPMVSYQLSMLLAMIGFAIAPVYQVFILS